MIALMNHKLDQIDLSLLRALQKEASLSQRDLAEQVGLSQNACWRRLKARLISPMKKTFPTRFPTKLIRI